MSKLVGGLESLTKYERESYKLNKIKFNISEVIRKILDNFQPDFENKNIRISFYGDNEEIFADKDKISQVIINLVANAIKYTLENGEIEVSIKDQIDSIEIRIKDTGIGISAEDLQFIFERFYRVDKSRNRLTGGFGIGLTIVKTIVDLHQGNISVKSCLEKGSEFLINIPKKV